MWRQVYVCIILGNWMLGQDTITNVRQLDRIMALNYPVTHDLQNDLFCVIFQQFISVYHVFSIMCRVVDWIIYVM